MSASATQGGHKKHN